jgi:GDP-L-fucose synthase
MKVLVTGGTGMVGSGFKNIKSTHDFILVGSSQYDLRSLHDTSQMVMDHKPDAIIHLAARVGGIKGNTEYVADFFTDNIQINTNVLKVAKALSVKKVVSLLSTCVYPDKVNYPLTEDQIHNGPPHPSNFGYAYAKRMLDVHSRALRQQYGCNFICAVPNNLYGPHDNFDLENGHVIPAIIRKIWEAKQTGSASHFWGSGRPLREFTYAPDIAKILVYLLENYNEAVPINIGRTGEFSIRSIVDYVCGILEYEGIIEWDISKPEGQFKKPSTNQKLLQLGWDEAAYTTMEEGLEATCSWFKENYPNVRGAK